MSHACPVRSHAQFVVVVLGVGLADGIESPWRAGLPDRIESPWRGGVESVLSESPKESEQCLTRTHFRGDSQRY